MNNREKLLDLLATYKLERREIAELVKVDVETVNNWVVSHESKHCEEVPDMAMELLELKLKDRPIPDGKE
jgi:hypothetical protein